jgi:hypothetical protein
VTFWVRVRGASATPFSQFRGPISLSGQFYPSNTAVDPG